MWEDVTGRQSICTTNAAWLVSTSPESLYTINKQLRAGETINKTLVVRLSSVGDHFGKAGTTLSPALKSLNDSRKKDSRLYSH